MPALNDRWHLIAPDYAGFGYSDTPDRTRFAYTFDGYADFLEQFTEAMNLTRCDIYEHEFGPKYKTLQDYWANPTLEGRKKLRQAVSEDGFAMNLSAKYRRTSLNESQIFGHSRGLCTRTA